MRYVYCRRKLQKEVMGLWQNYGTSSSTPDSLKRRQAFTIQQCPEYRLGTRFDGATVEEYM